MSEFGDIFASNLTSVVYVYASVMCLAAYAAITLWVLRRRHEIPEFDARLTAFRAAA
jgi:hypothetical protein